MYKLFLDDCRECIFDDFIVVRSVDEAISLIEKHGIPDEISFDHDLGTEKTGYDLAKYIEFLVRIENKQLPQNFKYFVHSQNPIGKNNIEDCMNSILEFISQEPKDAQT